MIMPKLILGLEDKRITKRHATAIRPRVKAETADRPGYTVGDGWTAGCILARLGIGHVAPLLDRECHGDLAGKARILA